MKQNQVSIDGLTPYTNYSISILGYTTAGDGVASAAVYATTDQDKPSSPEKIKVFMKSASSILVVWAAPLEPNGIITSYKVYCDRYRTQVQKSDLFNYWTSLKKLTFFLVQCFENDPYPS